MSSILTNNAASSALSTLRTINNNLDTTQNRISSGLKISSGKDNAAFFSISETLKSDSGIFSAVNDSLTLTKNSISTARLGAETVVDLVNQFSERVAFAQGGSASVRASVQDELDELAARINTTISQSTFNGTDLVNSNSAVTVVTGISRASAGTVSTTTVTFNQEDLGAIQSALAAVDLTTASTTTLQAAALTIATTQLSNATDSATSLGIAEKSIETQQTFLTELTDLLDSSVGSIVDANLEKEAARLQSLQVQQQLASQSLSIANKAPQNVLSLFR